MFKDEIGKKLNILGEMHPFSISIIGKNNLYICGIKSVINTTDTDVNIRLKNGLLHVSGKGFNIVEIGGGDMYIKGEVINVAFE